MSLRVDAGDEGVEDGVLPVEWIERDVLENSEAVADFEEFP
jgi:hypothetical protein